MICNNPLDPAQDEGTATLGSQKLLSPNSSMVGRRIVQFGEERDVPSIPRYAK